MTNEKYQLILGSGSPRRKELIADLFLPFKVETSDIEEKSDFIQPKDVVMDLAKQKGIAVLAQTGFKNPFVLAADTIVVLDNTILGKPHNREKAKKMLESLSGRSHDVYTGVAFITKDHQKVFYEKTQVFFSDIPSQLLEHYLDTKDSLDKAGAYGIQKYSQGFIKSIEGSYSNVVGLPVYNVLRELKCFFEDKFNIQDESWRNYFA